MSRSDTKHIRDIIKLTEFTRSILSHDFSAVPGTDPEGELKDIASLVGRLAVEYRDSLLRAEQTVSSLARTSKEYEDLLAYQTAIINNMADGLLVTDTEGRILRVNRALLEMTGLKEDGTIDRDIDEILASSVKGWIEKSVSAGQKEVLSAEINLPCGRTGKALATPIYNEDLGMPANGQNTRACIGVVILVRDITKEKEIDRMKTDFISTVSHELRTPLTSILGFAKIIRKRLGDVIIPKMQAEDEKTQRTLDQLEKDTSIIISEGERLTLLINNVLDIARMEAGKVEWKKDLISVRDIIDRAAAAVAPLFEQKGLELLRDIGDNLPEPVGDRDRLVQVLINLMANALKFTDTGSVTVRARKVGDVVEIAVIDTGIGIEKEDLDKIFDKFKQLGDTLTDRPRGTGLGLPIAKQIVEHHGGTLRVDSTPGKGSAFSFALPAESRTAPVMTFDLEAIMKHLKDHAGPAPSAGDGGKTILVVDDDYHIRQLLRRELEARGYGVIEASDGVEALGRLKRERPDLVVLDVMMPGISGFDVAAIIKNDPATMTVPVVMLSVLEDRERGYRIGVDRYFTKPADLGELMNEIAYLLSVGASRKKVLVLDEDASAARALCEVLETKGYSVDGVCSGPECIKKATEEKPDMIIIDILVSGRHDIIKTLRFVKGLEHVTFLLLGRSQ